MTATTALFDGAMRVRLNAAYARALERAGAVPLVVPGLAPGNAALVLSGVDGLVLSGGEDVDPSRYGAEPHPLLTPPNPERDDLELALVAAARARAVPTLAICRGIQVLNVALGGTLVQDISAEWPGAGPHGAGAGRADRSHAIQVEDGSRLQAALGASRLRVNSRHHQALARVAEPLRVAARADDGVVEGAEVSGDGWWAVGVQWHPEELIEDPEPWERRLFDAFVERARAASRSRAGEGRRGG